MHIYKIEQISINTSFTNFKHTIPRIRLAPAHENVFRNRVLFQRNDSVGH